MHYLRPKTYDVDTYKFDILSSGLTDSEVTDSRAKHGSNVLTPPKRVPWWKLFLGKFNDPIIRILLAAACLSLIVAFVEDDFAETIGIFCAIFLATGVSFYFEYDAGRKFDALNTLTDETTVPAVRGRQVVEIARRDIVVGDILLLEQGNEVPADGELMEAVALSVNESNLTGEQMAHKSADRSQTDKEATYPSHCLYRGTSLLEGHCVMRVTAVGDATEIGRVARQATATPEEPTPLNIQLTRLAHLINKVGFGVAGVTFVIFVVHDLILFLPQHPVLGMKEWLEICRFVLEYFMMAVTLIVMAVPEGLPMAVTLSLALNMRRMLKTNNLVRRLHACETMGAITVICTDKTGTLTQNRMRVAHLECVEGKEGLLDEAIAANTTAYLDDGRTGGIGNPTEVALLLWLHDKGVDYLPLREAWPPTDQLPFSTERKFMATATYSQVLGHNVLFVKGASEVLMEHCAPDAADFETVRAHLLAYQRKAMRTLAFAYKILPEGNAVTSCEALIAEGNLQWLGIAAISDPVREEVPAAIRQCMAAGIDVKVVTGDTSATATEVARQTGLWTDKDKTEEQITGKEFAALNDIEAGRRALKLKVMSRARPMDKQRLVQCLQHEGQVVAVTGDGTNDAPALNFAQVGLSMGSGTAVAKEASDITLLDDSFRSIVTAVLWGRSLYKNIQRFLLFQLTINLSALLIVLIGSFVGTDMPLTVTQMLWINMIMDTFAALALASLPPDVKVMNDKPRHLDAFILTPQMARNILIMALLLVVIMMNMIVLFTGLSDGMNPHQMTIFFTLFVMFQFWNLLNARAFGTNDSALKGIHKCGGLLLVLALILVGQIVIVQWGGKMFRTEPLTFLNWVHIMAATSLIFWGGEAVRLARRLWNRHLAKRESLRGTYWGA